MIIDIFLDSLKDVLKISVILYPFLVLMDLITHKYAKNFELLANKSFKIMPLLGGLIGLIPGHNFAVMISLLYINGFISLGTLLATFFSTSEEAIYIFIPYGKNPLPIMAIKFIIGVTVGTLVDFFNSRSLVKYPLNKFEESQVVIEKYHLGKKFNLKSTLIHGLEHTLKLSIIIFFTLFILEGIIEFLGDERLKNLILFFGPFQSFISSLVGLIPGCGSSIVISMLYIKGILPFGTTVSGLMTSTGLALLVLIGSGLKPKKIIIIISILLITSSFTGIVLNFIIR